MVKPPEGIAQAQYNRLCQKRDFYLEEAQMCAELTIPALMVDTTDIRNNTGQPPDLPRPWQSLGARGVRNLAAKLTAALLPVTGSFYRWTIAGKVQAEIEESEDAEQRAIKTELQKKLAARERAGMREVDAQGIRAKFDQGVRQLIVCGNVLLYLPPSGGMRVFTLREYVCRRDFMGNVVEIVFVEVLDRQTVPDRIRDVLDKEDPIIDDMERMKPKPVHVYTRIVREGNRYQMSQEVQGKPVEGMNASFAKDEVPFLALRFQAIDGEDYGRSYVSEFLGELQTLEDLTRSIKIASLNAAKINPIINPNSTITPRKFLNALNGQPLLGLPDDIRMLQQDKHADMSVAKATKDDCERALAAAFLMNSSFQRDAERVTAEEVRRLAEELEQSLGGVYSVLSQDFQLPLAKRMDSNLVRRGALPALPKGSVLPTVVTGLAALGRGQDLQRLTDGLGLLAQAEQIVPGMAARIDADDLLERIFIGVGVDTDGLFKSDEQMQQEQQTAQNTALMSQVAEGAAPAAGKAAVENGPFGSAGGAGAPPGPQG